MHCCRAYYAFTALRVLVGLVFIWAALFLYEDYSGPRILDQ